MIVIFKFNFNIVWSVKDVVKKKGSDSESASENGTTVS